MTYILKSKSPGLCRGFPTSPDYISRKAEGSENSFLARSQIVFHTLLLLMQSYLFIVFICLLMFILLLALYQVLLSLLRYEVLVFAMMFCIMYRIAADSRTIIQCLFLQIGTDHWCDRLLRTLL